MLTSHASAPLLLSSLASAVTNFCNLDIHCCLLTAATECSINKFTGQSAAWRHQEQFSAHSTVWAAVSPGEFVICVAALASLSPDPTALLTFLSNYFVYWLLLSGVLELSPALDFAFASMLSLSMRSEIHAKSPEFRRNCPMPRLTNILRIYSLCLKVAETSGNNTRYPYIDCLLFISFCPLNYTCSI